MKVLALTDGFMRYVGPQCEELVARGTRVVIVTRGHPFEFAGDRSEHAAVVAELRDRGVGVHVLPELLRDPHGLAMSARLGLQSRRWAPDVIHVQDGAEIRLLPLAPRSTPTVLTIHDPVPHPGHPNQGSPASQAASDFVYAHWRKRADVAIVHSDALKAELLAAGGPERVEVIPHGLELSPAPAPIPDEPTIGFFGRLQAYKGLDVLTAAIPLVWEQRPDVQFVIEGRGDWVPPFTDSRLRVPREYVPREHVDGLLKSLTLLVLPYTQASQSGPGNRAISFGIPVVVSDVGGLPDLTLDDSFVVPPGDPGALAQALVRHVDHTMGLRHRVHEELASPRSWVSVARQLEALYANLIEERARK